MSINYTRRKLHTPDGRINITHPGRAPQSILTPDAARAADRRARSVRLTRSQSVTIGRAN